MLFALQYGLNAAFLPGLGGLALRSEHRTVLLRPTSERNGVTELDPDFQERDYLETVEPCVDLLQRRPRFLVVNDTWKLSSLMEPGNAHAVYNQLLF